MNSKVSVIIPAYNTEAYIARAIESVLEQTYQNFEAIVVDDGSTDNTAKVAQQFSDKRLKVLIDRRNLGVSAARNRALREAKGNWIALLDSDDWFAPKRLENLLQVASTEKADLIADDLYFIRDGEISPWNTLFHEGEWHIDKIQQIDAVSFVNSDIPSHRDFSLGLTKPLIKREFLLKNGIEYDENLAAGEDFSLYLKCLVHKARFIIVPKPYYFYRNRQGSLKDRPKLDYLNQSCRIIRNFLKDKAVGKNTELVSALSKNLTIFQNNLSYYRVVEPLKQRKLWVAFMETVNNPYFFIYFMNKLPDLLRRRLLVLVKIKLLKLNFKNI